MNRIITKSLIGAVVAGTVMMGCSKILDEQPRSIFTPEYFKTKAGVEGGITAMYANLRYVYGNGYYYNASETGTDEATWGQNSDANIKDLDLTGVGQVTPSSSRSDVLWNVAFGDINTANGVIENATQVNTDKAGSSDTIPTSLIAEARFFRAFDYFSLVQTFGGVPLDLGAGELKFNTTTARTSVRKTVPEVYTKAVFPDLVKAVEDLPVNPRVTGGVTKTVARLYLAKAYLTYGWWLQNPGNIPTYPAADRTDPDGHNAAWYFQQAYTVATTAINNPGPYGLEPTFYDLNVATNDRNMEVLLYADHTESSETYNGGSLTYSTGGSPDNFAGWFPTWNYTTIRSGNDASWSATTSSVQREAVQSLGRPWTMMVPPLGVFTNTFADKTNDSRFDGTFVTVYRGNWAKGGVAAATLYNANNLPIQNGDPVLSFVAPGTYSGTISYPGDAGKNNVGAGTLPGRSDFVISLDDINRIAYPGNWKLGPYRTDNGTGLGQPNAGSTRPYNIAKFSELYFIAAEAAVKGAATLGGMTARDLINVIRARAGKWTYNLAENQTEIADHSAAMVAATPSTITIDYILAERSREYFGEGYRWLDLVRTQKLAELGGKYEIAGTNWYDHTPKTFTRDYGANNYLYLRPIPQGEMDALQMSEAEKTAYQNPGYE